MIETAGNWRETPRNIYFLAGAFRTSIMTSETFRGDVFSGGNGRLIYPYLLIAVNEINPSIEDAMTLLYEAGASWFIDSGIFNLTNDHMRAHGITMDKALALAPDQIDGFQDLFDKYVGIVSRWGSRCWGYIELDQGGRENKIKTRAILEGMGLRPIPVYHPFNDGWDYFDELANKYDRICVGNVVQADANTRLRLISTMWERKRRYPDLWIHLLGYTPNELLNAYPIDSGDSSSWLNVVRWSGLQERSALKTVGGMHKNYQYVLGNTKAPGREWAKSISMSAYASAMNARNWHNHIETLKGLGMEIYPPYGS